MKSLSPPARRRDAALWFALLGSPVAWLVQFQANYTLVPWLCAHHLRWPILAISTACLLVAGAAGVCAWKNLRRPVHRDDEEPAPELEGRSRFMARLAIFTSALFLLVTIAQALGVFFLNPCAE